MAMRKQVILITLLCAIFCACKQRKTENNSPEIPADSTNTSKQNPRLYNCSEDSTVKYLLFLPENISGEIPLLVFFDPSGNAALPVIRYKELAQKMGIAIAGSMNSRNGQTIGQSVYFGKTLINDIINKNKIDKERIFAGGFSGGARVASRLAEMNPQIKAVIGNSAGFDISSGYFPKFGFIGIGGSADMNMLELVNTHKYLNGSKTPHMLLMFNGTHEWAPAQEMEKSILWMLCLSKHPDAKSQLDKIESEIKAIADSLENKNNLLQAATEWETLLGCSKFLDLNNKNAEDNYYRIKKLPGFNNLIDEMSGIWNKETAEQNRLMQGFQKWNITEWEAETASLKKTSEQKTQTGSMHKRLLGFLSLYFYSNTNRTLATSDSSASGRSSAIYTIVDPENPEAWFLRAIHLARYQHNNAAKLALALAQTKGFNDQTRVAAQPELMQLMNNP
ncbi:MAG: hypothetical protein RLZZ46_886 [Bacteroidota bacterium]|jgi:poly(3-hydroxybutyrate) depolymerase